LLSSIVHSEHSYDRICILMVHKKLLHTLLKAPVGNLLAMESNNLGAFFTVSAMRGSLNKTR